MYIDSQAKTDPLTIAKNSKRNSIEYNKQNPTTEIKTLQQDTVPTIKQTH